MPKSFSAAVAALTGWQNVVGHFLAMDNQCVEMVVVSDSEAQHGAKVAFGTDGSTTAKTGVTQYGWLHGFDRALYRLGIQRHAGPVVGAGNTGFAPSFAGVNSGGTGWNAGASAPGSTLDPLFAGAASQTNTATGFSTMSYVALGDDISEAAASAPATDVLLPGADCLPISGSTDGLPVADWSGLNLTWQVQYGLFGSGGGYSGTATFQPKVRLNGVVTGHYDTLTTAGAAIACLSGVTDSLTIGEVLTSPFSAISALGSGTAAGLDYGSNLDWWYNGAGTAQGPLLMGHNRIVPKALTNGACVSPYYAHAGYTVGQAQAEVALITQTQHNTFNSFLTYRQNQLVQQKKVLVCIMLGTNDCTPTATTQATFKANLISLINTDKAFWTAAGIDARYLVMVSQPVNDYPANSSGDPLRAYNLNLYLTAADQVAASRSDTCSFNWATAGWTARKLGNLGGYDSSNGLPLYGSGGSYYYHLSRYGYEALALDFIGALVTLAAASSVANVPINQYRLQGQN